MGGFADIMNSVLGAIGLHADRPEGPPAPRAKQVPRKPHSPSPALVRQGQRGFYEDPRSDTGWSYSNPKGQRKSGVDAPTGREGVITTGGRMNAARYNAQDWKDLVSGQYQRSAPDVLQMKQWMMPDITRPTSLDINAMHPLVEHNPWGNSLSERPVTNPYRIVLDPNYGAGGFYG